MEQQSCSPHKNLRKTSRKLIPKIGGVGPRESFLDIRVLEANLQQQRAALVQCTHKI